MKSTGLKNALACIALTVHTAVCWAGCSDVIALSRTTSRTVSSESDFATMAKAFCAQYSSNKASASGMTIGFEYGGVGGNFGSSEANAEAIAKKTCDSLNTQNVSSSAYQNYVETIAPGAYASYQKCIVAAEGGIQFSADPGAALETSMTIGVTNTSRNGAPISQTFEFQESDGISCKWKDAATAGGQKTLPNNNTSSVYCTRSDSSKRGSVVVYSTTRGDVPVTFVWQEYREGQKVDDLRAIQARTLVNEFVLSSLKKAVVAFNATTCPQGWFQYKPANGMFIRGIDVGGNNVDPSGQRAPNDIQSDLVKSHRHQTDGSVVQNHDANGFFLGAPSGGAARQLRDAEIGVRGDGEGMGVETRPKNIALLYCSKE